MLCFKKEVIDNGFCVTINDVTTCHCLSGFIGDTCEICEFTLMDNKCYQRNSNNHGECY